MAIFRLQFSCNDANNQTDLSLAVAVAEMMQ